MASNPNAIQTPNFVEQEVRAHRPLATELSAHYASTYARPDLKDDMEQEGLIAMGIMAQGWDPTRGGHLTTALLNHARWAILHYIDRELHPRRQGAQIVYVDLDPGQVADGDEDDLADMIDTRIRAGAVQGALGALTDRQRQILLLATEDVAIRGTARVMGLSAATVSAELRNAMKSIRKQLHIQEPVDERAASSE
ncbi:MAG: sigma-70 family RNA polymerase sigma factor [Syntrophorhabdales bacterium]|jgi:DNA-directed RNA polymerase specialized sigma24 family protein